MKNAGYKFFLSVSFFLLTINQMNAQTLDVKQQSIVKISAFTTVDKIRELKTALNGGLNAGLTVNEIKEELVQLYAYCGFPRSLNGITAFMAVLEERKAKGINDIIGKEASPISGSTNKYDTGKKTLQALTGKNQDGPLTGANAFATSIDIFLKEHLFADIFSRDILDYTQRELATIAALASMGGADSQLQAHLGMGLHIGIAEAQLRELLVIIGKSVDKKREDAGSQVLAKALGAK
jgi:4-carboxymuconolactone decarboxylase